MLLNRPVLNFMREQVVKQTVIITTMSMVRDIPARMESATNKVQINT